MIAATIPTPYLSARDDRPALLPDHLVREREADARHRARLERWADDVLRSLVVAAHYDARDGADPAA